DGIGIFTLHHVKATEMSRGNFVVRRHFDGTLEGVFGLLIAFAAVVEDAKEKMSIPVRRAGSDGLQVSGLGLRESAQIAIDPRQFSGRPGIAGRYFQGDL